MSVRGLIYLVSVLLSACQSLPERPADLADCPDVRPQVCTMIYAPVCAMEKDGNFRTYSSDCTACSHDEVIGYQQGMCAPKK